MEQSTTSTKLIKKIQKLNIDDVFIFQLNEYINERDNLRQRVKNNNILINDYNNQSNNYKNLDKRTKQAKQLKQQLLMKIKQLMMKEKY